MEAFTFDRVWNVQVPPHYKERIYHHIETMVDSTLHQRILEPLFGRVSIREGQHNTVVIRLITTIHGKSHTVGLILAESSFGDFSERDIADKLAHSFLHDFGSLALSAFLNPSFEDKEGEEK